MQHFLLKEFKCILVFPLFFVSVAVAFAQGVTVQGKVTDESGEGLPGVTVLLKGTTTATPTGVDGTYTLHVPDANGTLVFSFIGYQMQEVPINGRTTVNVQMGTDAQTLEEVVVVGYGQQKRATVTGAVTSVQAEDLVKAPVTNVTNSLTGRLPGLSTVTRSGEPGNDNSTIRIRGTNSLGNNDALIVVDGVPGRSLASIDQNSIESITVLKDASAAIYGAQAANGVILVTTKRGKVGKPVITVNFNQGFNRPTRIPDMTNAAEYATALNELDMYRDRAPRFTPEEIQKFRDGSDPWRYPDTDWFAEVLKPWSGQNYGNLTVSGGSESMRYFLSLGAKSQDGYYYDSGLKYNQYNFRSNLDGDISKNITIGFDVAGRMEDRNYPTRSAGDIFWMVMRGKPNMPAYWPNGMPGPDIEYGNNPVVVSTKATGYDRNKWYFLNTNARVNIKIPWVEGLSINGNAAIDKGFRFHKRFQTPWYLYSWDGTSYDAEGNPVLIKGQRGTNDPNLTQNSEDNLNVLLNAMVNYERTIANEHAINFMAGTERRTGRGDYFSAYRRYFVSTALDQLDQGGQAEKNNGGSAYHSARLNYFGRVNYNYRERYLLEFVWRYDGSYIFPESKRFGFFPGVSAGWRISEEDFWKNNLSVIENFKLRVSWGQTGNDRIDEWQYLSTYGFNNDQRYVFGIDQEASILNERRIPNPNITWEVANQSNIGIEAGLLNNKLTFEADYFYNVRSQILWNRNASVPASTGLTLPRENIGKVVNRGFDFNVGYRDQIGDIFYQVSVNGGYAKNKIKFWDEAPGVPEYQQSTGKPIPSDPANPNNDLYYQAIGIFRDQAEIDAYPHWPGTRPGDVIFEDVNQDGVIDGNDRVRSDKRTIPTFTGGLSLDLQYKAFDFSVLFQGATGAVRYIYMDSGDIGNYLQDYYDNRWTPENPDASYPRVFNRNEEYWRNNRNTIWLRNTDYIRLKNIQIGYNLPSQLTQKLKIEGLRVYLSGFNLLTYSPDLKDFDPEADNQNGTNYPLQKVVNAGFSFTF